MHFCRRNFCKASKGKLCSNFGPPPSWNVFLLAKLDSSGRAFPLNVSYNPFHANELSPGAPRKQRRGAVADEPITLARRPGAGHTAGRPGTWDSGPATCERALAGTPGVTTTQRDTRRRPPKPRPRLVPAPVAGSLRSGAATLLQEARPAGGAGAGPPGAAALPQSPRRRRGARLSPGRPCLAL